MNDIAGLTVKTLLILTDVKFFDYVFRVRESHAGVVLFAEYVDKDIYTGKPELQATRKWPITPAMTKSEIVQTAFKCCLTSMEHRTREAFKYKDARVFGPHFDVDDLVRLCVNREDAGARVQMQPFREMAMKDDYFAGTSATVSE